MSRAQLLAAGISGHTIDHRATNGHLHRAHRGVYFVGHTALAPHAAERAALLACGEGALISHWSAAYLWGLMENPPSEIHVATPGRHCRSRNGIRLHRVKALDPRDVRVKDGIPLTAPARALIDLAAETGYDVLERMLAGARVKKLVSDRELKRALERAGHRAGTGRMRGFLKAEQGPALTRSKAERLMRRLIRAAGLPGPQTNVRVEGWEVDFFWPDQRLIVEVDGFLFHGHRAAFERDRRKQLALAAAGYRVIRITWMQLLHEALLVAAKLAQALTTGS